MYKNFKIVKIDSKYCNYLRKYDDKVSYNAGLKELCPFVGVLFSIGNCEYFATLSSPKPKHKLLKNTLDLLKIENGLYGVINFNNMIPVKSNNYIAFDLNKETTDKQEMNRIQLLRNQLRFLNANKKKVLDMSMRLYRLYKNNCLSENVRERCCNFPLLEEKCEEYNLEMIEI